MASEPGATGAAAVAQRGAARPAPLSPGRLRAKGSGEVCACVSVCVRACACVRARVPGVRADGKK